MKWLVVGIAGPSCSGKTTLAEFVKKRIKNSILVKQDDYFLSMDDPRLTLIPELNHYNWEIFSSLDMSKMYDDIMKIIIPAMNGSNEDKVENNDTRLLIIEGFLIYNFKPIANLCTIKYFLETSKEVCWNRRKSRVYDPPDIPGYFSKVVWPEYLKNRHELISDENFCKSVKFLDGCRCKNELCDQVVDDIIEKLC